MTRYIMIIIQFLYNKFSYEIKRRLLPFYILHIISVILMAVLSEQYREELKAGHSDHASKEKDLKIIFQSICSAINLFNMYYIIR